MSCCYILYSKEIDHFYIGSTSLKPEERLKRHLEEYYGKQKFTAQVKDWEIFYVIECSTIEQAKKVEKHIKRMKSRKYIQNLVKYPEISHRLKEKYK